MEQYYTYIMANKKNGVLYVGVTNDIIKRSYEHKVGIVKGFTKRYNIKILVYYEIHGSIEAAITREKQIKKWKRDWKIELIEKENPEWNDLYGTLI